MKSLFEFFQSAKIKICCCCHLTESMEIEVLSAAFSKLNFVKENSLDKDSYTSEYNLGSLGQLFRNNAKDFCRQKIKFLQSDPTKTSTIRSKILEKNNKKKSKICGISWNSKNQKIGKFKNIDLHEFIGILNMPDIIFINLQYESNIDDVVSFSIRNKIEIIFIKLYLEAKNK